MRKHIPDQEKESVFFGSQRTPMVHKSAACPCRQWRHQRRSSWVKSQVQQVELFARGAQQKPRGAIEPLLNLEALRQRMGQANG